MTQNVGMEMDSVFRLLILVTSQCLHILVPGKPLFRLVHFVLLVLFRVVFIKHLLVGVLGNDSVLKIRVQMLEVRSF